MLTRSLSFSFSLQEAYTTTHKHLPWGNRPPVLFPERCSRENEWAVAVASQKALSPSHVDHCFSVISSGGLNPNAWRSGLEDCSSRIGENFSQVFYYPPWEAGCPGKNPALRDLGPRDTSGITMPGGALLPLGKTACRCWVGPSLVYWFEVAVNAEEWSTGASHAGSCLFPRLPNGHLTEGTPA